MRNKILFAALAGGLLLMLGACGSGGDPSASGTSSGSSGASSGGGSSSSSGGSSSGSSSGRVFSGSVPPSTLTLPAGSQGFVRTVDGRQVLYVVPDPAPTTPGPLMIMLDYLGGNPTFMADLVLAGPHAAKGEILAFPAHTGLTWNNGVYAAQIFSNPQTDIVFLSDVINDATTNLPVDASKISMTGFSEGGFMADLFACDKPGMLVGFGMVGAAQVNTTTCETGTPLKMMMFAGSNDKEVPYNGFDTVDSAPTTLSIWETIDSCSGSETATTLPVVVNDGTSVVQHQIPACNAILYQIVNGGHNWPDGEVTPSTTLLGTTTQNIDATQAQWDFFTGS